MLLGTLLLHLLLLRALLLLAQLLISLLHALTLQLLISLLRALHLLLLVPLLHTLHLLLRTLLLDAELLVPLLLDLLAAPLLLALLLFLKLLRPLPLLAAGLLLLAQLLLLDLLLLQNLRRNQRRLETRLRPLLLLRLEIGSPWCDEPRRHAGVARHHADRQAHRLGLAIGVAAPRTRAWQEDRHRNRQKARVRKARRRQIDIFARRRGQEINRRRGRIVGLVEDHHRPRHIFIFVRRRGGDPEIIFSEYCRRIESCRQDAQATMRVGNMRSARIKADIAPVGRRRVACNRASPRDGFAPRRQHGRDARAQRIARIGGHEFLIRNDRVAFERQCIGLADRQITDDAVAGGQCLRRRRILGALEEGDGLAQARGIPRHLCAARRLADTQTGPRKDFACLEPALVNHFRQRLGIDPIIAGLLRCDRARRGVEGNERPSLGHDNGQTACQGLAGGRERIGARRIQHDETRLQRQVGQRPREVRDPQGLDRYAGIAGNAGFDGGEVIFARILQSVAGKIDEGDGVRPGGCRLLEEVPEGTPQAFLIEVAGTNHLEARLREGLGDQAGIIRRGGKTARPVVGIADHQRNARLGSLRLHRRDEA